jgi:hypothetical protein
MRGCGGGSQVSGVVTETNWTLIVLFGMQHRPFGPYLMTIRVLILVMRLWPWCAEALAVLCEL